MNDPNQPQQAMQPYQQPMGAPVQYVQIPMVQNQQGQWVPYQQGMSQLAPGTQVAPAAQGMKLGTALVTLAAIGFGIKMLYEWAKGREGGGGGDGDGHRTREDHVSERNQRRSKARMLAEFQRYLETHDIQEDSGSDHGHRSHERGGHGPGYHDVREESRGTREDAREDAREE